MNMDFLSPMMIKESGKLVFMNLSEGKVFETKINGTELILVEIDQSTSTSCFEELENQRNENNPEIPTEQILKVLSTEKDLTKQNEKHIFRRDST